MCKSSASVAAEFRTPLTPKGRATIWKAMFQRLFQRSQALGGSRPSSQGCYHQLILYLWSLELVVEVGREGEMGGGKNAQSAAALWMAA